MPLYDFKNKSTGEVFEKSMRISEMEEYLAANPDIERHHASAQAIIDPVRLGVRRPDAGFKEVLQRIHEKTPGSRLNKTSNI